MDPESPLLVGWRRDHSCRPLGAGGRSAGQPGPQLPQRRGLLATLPGDTAPAKFRLLSELPSLCKPSPLLLRFKLPFFVLTWSELWRNLIIQAKLPLASLLWFLAAWTLLFIVLLFLGPEVFTLCLKGLFLLLLEIACFPCFFWRREALSCCWPQCSPRVLTDERLWPVVRVAPLLTDGLEVAALALGVVLLRFAEPELL